MAKWDHDDLRSNPDSPYWDPIASGETPSAAWTSTPPPATPLKIVVETEPMRILQECIDLLKKKGSDYQNPNSKVKQAMYYEHGLTTLMDIINAKRLRLVSLIETFENDPTTAPKNESIEDSFKDMVNYCAIAAAWCRGLIEGQDPKYDILNRLKPKYDISYNNPSSRHFVTDKG